jgi:hypothetical protein
VSTNCEACSGTGRFQGRFSGPEWPNCPACKGTGFNEFHETFVHNRLNTAYGAINNQTAIINFAKTEFLAAIAYLAAAVSAYEKYAGNVGRRSVRDPFFNTRLDDYQQALKKARESYAELEAKINEM